ncbi:MAG: enoyl-CoA hydratase [Gemmatimonadota bacterium]
MNGSVTVALRDNVAIITMEREEARNALTWRMYEQLSSVLDEVARNRSVGLIVLRGSGSHFSGGTDIAQFVSFTTGVDGVAYERRLEEVIAAVEGVSVPTLAVVRGSAVGAGLVLAAACDIRICTPDAVFGAPIARTLGNCLSVANTRRLVRHLGPARTSRLLLMADLLRGEEALTSGFVAAVVAPAELDSRIADLATRLSGMSPSSLTAIKEALRRVPDPAASDDDLIESVYGSREFREGVRAFLDKRPPRWR